METLELKPYILSNQPDLEPEVIPAPKRLGRPKIYDPNKYVEEVYSYVGMCNDEELEFHKTRGEKSDSYERVLKVNLPTIEGFCRHSGVVKSSLYEWAKEYPNLMDALDYLRSVQHDRLIKNGLNGSYNPMITKLILAHNHGYKDSLDLTSKGKQLPQPILNVLLNNNSDKESSSPKEED